MFSKVGFYDQYTASAKTHAESNTIYQNVIIHKGVALTYYNNVHRTNSNT